MNWTTAEDNAILLGVRVHGTQWPTVAEALEGRSTDGVRNRWHRLQKAHQLHDTVEGRARLDALLLARGIEFDATQPGQSWRMILDEGIKGSEKSRHCWTAEEDAASACRDT